MSWHIFTATAALAVGMYKGQFQDRDEPDVFVAANSNALPMEPSPINPDWVIAGNPVARSALHSRPADSYATMAAWDCTAGQFRWFFGWDEMVVILEGDVHVTAEDGTARLLTVGDMAYFKAGTWATWRIDNYVKKAAVMRKPFPLPVSLLYRTLGRLRSAIKGRQSEGVL